MCSVLWGVSRVRWGYCGGYHDAPGGILWVPWGCSVPKLWSVQTKRNSLLKINLSSSPKKIIKWKLDLTPIVKRFLRHVSDHFCINCSMKGEVPKCRKFWSLTCQFEVNELNSSGLHKWTHYAGINFIHNHPPGTRLEGSKNPPLGTIIVYKNLPLGTEQGVKIPIPGTWSVKISQIYL